MNRGYFTATQLAELLGRPPSTVVEWIVSGRLNLSKRHGKFGIAYQFSHESVWDWMEDMASWHLWEPAKIKDAHWREHFTELRRGWLDKHQAAEMLIISADGVSSAVCKGKLKSHKAGYRSRLWFREEDVIEYQRTVQR